MKTSMNQPFYVCGCCQRELPPESFYRSDINIHRDNYCRECRKAVSKQQYRAKMRKKNKRRLIITEVNDPEVRKALIMQALRVVVERMKRKRKMGDDLMY